MTSESPNRKRKRGPPVGASDIDDDASKKRTRRPIGAVGTSDGRDELETDDGLRREKRVPSKKGSRGPPARKTVRRSLAHESGPDEVMNEDDNGESSILQPRRSGRKRHSATEMRWIFNTVSPESSAANTRQRDQGAAHPQPKRRGRPSLKEVSISEAQSHSPSEVNLQKKKKPGRPSLQNSREGDTSDAKRKTGTSRGAKKALPEVSESGQRRHNRDRISDPPVPDVPRSRASASSTSRGQGRTSKDSIGQQKAVSSQTKRNSNRSAPVAPGDDGDASDGDGNEGDKAASPSKYHRLVSRKRSIPRSVITGKWSRLDPSSIAVIGSIMYDAQRTVLSRIPDKNFRRDHAHAAMSAVNRRLKSKLVKGMPFPPPSAKISVAARKSDSGTSKTTGTYEEELNFEKTVDYIQTLHAQLDPLQHSAALLQREREREEVALEKDYEDLHALEANARAEARTWQQRSRRAHILAPERRKLGEEVGSPGVGGDLEILQRGSEQTGNIFKASDDEELLSVSQQISSHMESMRDNLQQVDGILPGITKSGAALQDVLQKHLGPDQYERALLG